MQSCHSEFHPQVAISRVGVRSRKRHGGLTPVAKNSCLSATDPEVVVAVECVCRVIGQPKCNYASLPQFGFSRSPYRQ